MKTLTEAEKAYLAGIIDGEGSICLARHTNRRAAAHCLASVVKVSNTDGVLIEWLAAKTGCGSVYHHHRSGPFRDVFILVWSVNDGIAVLEATLPYLVIKRSRAEIVLSLHKKDEAARLAAGGRFGSGRPVPQWLREEREKSFQELAVLNRRGR